MFMCVQEVTRGVLGQVYNRCIGTDGDRWFSDMWVLEGSEALGWHWWCLDRNSSLESQIL